MEKTVVIGGKTYKLVPQETEDVMSGYELKDKTVSGYPRAVPKVSDYRERFKQRKLRANEVIAPPKVVDTNKSDTILDGYNYKGESLIFGPGLEQEW